MLERLTRVVIGAPKAVLAVTVVLLALCGIYGFGAADRMLSGGFADPGGESAQAQRTINDVFDRGGAQIFIKLDGPTGTDMSTDAAARAVGNEITDYLETLDYVQRPILTVWSAPELAGELLSKDRRSTQIVATLAGGDNEAPGHARTIEEHLVGVNRGITVKVGGQALVFQQVDTQTRTDLAVAEAIAIPISFLLLIVIFGGVVAAAVPVLIGIVAIIGTLALLRVIAEFADVSIFALNLTTAMGLALAIDYTLLIVTRYREEVAAGRPRPEAIVRTVDTAGRTVLFSAVTVALALAALAIFPMYFLRSFAYAGVGVVAVAAGAAIIVTPALLMLLGDRVDAIDLRRLARRLLRRPEPVAVGIENTRWYRVATWVLRRAVPVAVGVVALLIVLGLPFFSIKFGFPDERVLPATASSHQVQDEVRAEYAENTGGTSVAVVSGYRSVDDIGEYAKSLSKIAGVSQVTAPSGVYRDGNQVAPGVDGNERDGIALLNITSAIVPMSQEAQDQVKALRAATPPDGVQARFSGMAANNVDVIDSLYRHLPWVMLVIAVATYVLLFLFTGSVVLPLKALVLNVLSLTATFGAMVWIFQEGHFGGFGTTPMGHLVATMPVLMFCIAFGLSMDYEVFLLGRIREEWVASGQTRQDNDRAVAIGIARTGRVVTAAALLMSIVFAAIAASEVSFMRMFGVGLTLAVLMDATIIRMMLVPAFMRLAGRWNWWAPGPLRRLHDRFGLAEEKSEPAPTSVAAAASVADGRTDRKE